MNENKKVEVLIDGRNFTIVGNEPRDYIRGIASYVDEKITEVTDKNDKLSGSMAATLAAINITDEYFKAKTELVKLKEEAKEPIEKYDELIEELENSKRKIEELNKKYEESKLHINNLEDEKEENDFKIKDNEKVLELKEKELKDNEDTIKRLQDKVFDSQVELIETKKELDESLKSFEKEKIYSREEV